MGFPCDSAGKESACDLGDMDSIPGLGRSPGEGKGYPLQYCDLENSINCISPWGHRVGHDWAIFTFFPQIGGRNFLRAEIFFLFAYIFLEFRTMPWHIDILGNYRMKKWVKPQNWRTCGKESEYLEYPIMIEFHLLRHYQVYNYNFKHLIRSLI